MRERPHLRSGVVPVLLVPFDSDGAVDVPGLRREIEFLLELPIAGLGIGFGSEVTRLTFEEKLLVVGIAAEMKQDSMPLVASLIAGGTHVGAALAKALGDAGATVLMAPPPTGVGSVLALRDQVVDYYHVLALASGAEIMVQDAPAMTGVELPLAMFEALFELPDVTSFKVEVVAPAPKIGALRSALGDDAVLFGGQAGLDFYHELQRGVNGTLPGSATPEVFLEAFRRFEDDDYEGSNGLLSRHLGVQLLAQRDFDTFLYVQKLLLVRRGIFNSPALRGPCVPLDPQLEREVAELADSLLDVGGIPVLEWSGDIPVGTESEFH
jgi:4-hydroxy-tetrahydrodipicolinate synthase